MSKFDGLISAKDQELIESIFSTLNADSKGIINIVETIENIFYLQPKFFERFSYSEKTLGFLMMVSIFDVILDETINPLAKEHFLKAFDAFNNNIIDPEPTCEQWDELNQCCMWNRLEKVVQQVWDCEDSIVQDSLEEMP